MNLGLRVLVAVVLLGVTCPGWAAFERSIALCQSPSPSQRQTLEALARKVDQTFSPAQCAVLYHHLSTKKKINFFRKDGVSDLSPLGELTSLQSLYVSGVHFSVDLSHLSGLSELVELTFASHTLKVSAWESIGNFHKLKVLIVEHSQIDNLAPLANLKELEKLEMNRSRISNLAPLIALTRLRSLSLASNLITDLRPLSKLTNLEDLMLLGNKISDIRPLQNMTKLKTLYLTNNKVSDLTPLAGLMALEQLFLDNNAIEDVSPLQGLVNMKKLVLSSNHLRDVTPLRNLQKLRELMLSYNQITDTSVLTGMKDMRIFNVILNPLRDCMPQAAHEIRAGMKCPDEKTPVGKK